METALVKIEGLQQGIESLPTVLERNSTSTEKAREAMRAMLDTIESNGGIDSPGLDQAVNDLLARVRLTLTKMDERRKPITGILNQVTKMFTTLENELDQKNIGTEAYRLQKYREVYANRILEERKKEEQRVAMEAARKQEENLVANKILVQVQEVAARMTAYRKSQVLEIFKGLTLENIAETEQALNSISTAMHPSMIQELTVSINVRSSLISQDVIRSMIVERVSKNTATIAFNYEESVAQTKRQVIALIPSRIFELEEIKRADANKREKMEAEARKREMMRLEQVKVEQEKAMAEARARAEQEALLQQTQTLFEETSELASIRSSEPVKIKEVLEIEVLSPVGYMPIIAFYFEKEGLNETIDKLEKKTLGSMKKFCEAWTNKTGEHIQHPGLIYKSVAKVSTRK